jgi:hypothetical protein
VPIGGAGARPPCHWAWLPPGGENLAKGTPCLSTLASRKDPRPLSRSYVRRSTTGSIERHCGRASAAVDVDGGRVALHRSQLKTECRYLRLLPKCPIAGLHYPGRVVADTHFRRQRRPEIRTKTTPNTENALMQGVFSSGRRDLNSGPLVPQTSALTRLRHAPLRD